MVVVGCCGYDIINPAGADGDSCGKEWAKKSPAGVDDGAAGVETMCLLGS